MILPEVASLHCGVAGSWLLAVSHTEDHMGRRKTWVAGLSLLICEMG